jgi:chromatin remodeling complex protein RSC6
MSTSTAANPHLATLLGSRHQTATRTDILTALLRYITKHNLLSEDHMVHPDAFLADLLDSTEPVHVKDLFQGIRRSRPRSSSG